MRALKLAFLGRHSRRESALWTSQILLPCALLASRHRSPTSSGRKTALPLRPIREKSRLDYLKERKDVIYDNLRDLNFEFRAGKFPEDDYNRQRDNLEHEAAQVLAEMDTLTAAS